MEERSITLEYTSPVPDEMKKILERALKISFEGGEISWITDRKVKIEKYRLRGLYVN